MQPDHDFNRVTSVKLLKIVLALYRKELVDIPDAGHTDDILLLLRLANGDGGLIAWATSVTGASAKDIRESCVAFVERTCFSGDTDPFGVLGLNPWADAEAVKEHYRLLIRIFHPDRGQVSNTRAEAYSAIINQAYALLKHKVAHGGGNLSDRASVSQGVRSGIAPHRYIKPVNTQANGGDSLRWASRLTPAKVLCATALLAGLIIYLSFPQKIRKQTLTDNVIEKPQQNLPLHSYPAVSQTSVAEVEPLSDALDNDGAVEVLLPVEGIQTITTEQLPVEVNAAVSHKSENLPALKKALINALPASVVGDKKTMADNTKHDTKPLFAKDVEVKPVNKTKVVQTAVAVVAAPSNVMPDSGELLLSKKLSLPSTEGAKLVEASDVPIQPKTVKSIPVDLLTDRELHNIISSFMSSYANGDVDAFMQIFDEQVSSNEGGGKSGLYRAYEDLFAKTDSRSIVLKDLQWKKQGSFAVAHADYRASTLRAGESQGTTSFGEIQIEVVKTGGRVMISGFFYQDTKK